MRDMGCNIKNNLYAAVASLCHYIKVTSEIVMVIKLAVTSDGILVPLP